MFAKNIVNFIYDIDKSLDKIFEKEIKNNKKDSLIEEISNSSLN